VDFIWILIIVIIVLTGTWLLRYRGRGRPIPELLLPGKPLPEFKAVDENGASLTSLALRGSVAVLLFVRGSWCPFCTKQVADLTTHYKEITDSGARLILLTPRPLETTRRVADFFDVEFEFWLDESLEIAKQLGLLHESSVPDAYRKEYGEDTVWPTTLIVDANGTVRYTELSRSITDRPDPEKLLAIINKL